MIKIVRAAFLIIITVVSIAYISDSQKWSDWELMLGGVLFTFLVISADIFLKRKNLTVLSGIMFGLLVGILTSLSVTYLAEQVVRALLGTALSPNADPIPDGFKMLMSLVICYVSISFILQTKDDFRFIIPYVEFQRAATKGPRPIILDTSVIIDGRIADMAATGMFETPLIVPRFVLLELQTIADSAERLKRARGRRGLEVLEKLKTMPRIELRFWDGTLTHLAASDEAASIGVDQKLVLLAQQEHGRIMTNDFNLNKVAGLRGISVININTIAEALKPVVLPGETMLVRIIKPGENAGQGVGYLMDGTMVVIEGGDKVGQEIDVVVTNMIQNAAGKMIFGRMEAGRPVAPAPEAAKASAVKGNVN